MRPGEFRAENRAKADTTAADDDDRFADLYLRVVVDDAEAGGERVREQAADFKVRVGRDCGHAIFGQDGELLKRGDWAGIAVLAVPLINRAARFDAAPGPPMGNHPVAGFDLADFRDQFANDAAGLVAEQVR